MSINASFRVLRSGFSILPNGRELIESRRYRIRHDHRPQEPTQIKMPYAKKNAQQNDAATVKVIVPKILPPDRRILVRVPDGRQISAVVPKGCPAGSAILVQIPPHPHPSKQKTSPPQPPTPRVQTIKVPASKRKRGDKFNVRLPDGRTITATVPFDGCREFSLDTSTQSKQQRQQNWHNNPLAVAPMVLGPLMM
jgi:hypothetical protein